MSTSTPPVRTSSDPTPRQLQVLDRISYGHTDKEIGKAFGITVHGARHRCTRMFTRLGADNRAHAVRLGFELGLLLSSNPQRQPCQLSRRQQHVLDLISWGATNKLIAQRLGLSHRYTVALASTVYCRLVARNRPHAVRIGFELGLLKPHQRWGGAS